MDKSIGPVLPREIGIVQKLANYFASMAVWAVSQPYLKGCISSCCGEIVVLHAGLAESLMAGQFSPIVTVDNVVHGSLVAKLDSYPL